MINDEYIFTRFENLENINKNNLLDILKEYSKSISIYDMMIATNVLKEDGKYVQASYREKYLEVYIKYFIMRIKEINEYKESNTSSKINFEEFNHSIDLLKDQFNKNKLSNQGDSRFPLIYTLCSLYTTYIIEEPIHPVGTPFPGNLEVEEINGVYYCPVKDKQDDNPNAVCNLCLALQSE
ncbi:DUF2115 domain-containing protein [Methanobrevibacter sp. OttesenSCG-928-K11]|nr:DUF2115 domain-containing protein [Methanobrevibacter sp. OttesenSCG-928-K11]